MFAEDVIIVMNLFPIEMIKIDHRIGEIEYQTTSIEKVFYLKDNRLNLFQVPGLTPNVYHRFHLLNLQGEKKEKLRKLELKSLTHCVKNPGESESPLLEFPVVKKRLADVALNPDRFSLEICPASITIYDFALPGWDYYYDSDVVVLKGSWSEVHFSVFLPIFNAVMIHSSAIVRHNRALVFLASDGGGKTTVALNCPTEAILCDDQVILRKIERSYYAYGTPWGKYFNLANAHLGAFIVLEKSDHFKIKPLKNSLVMEYLWEENKLLWELLPKKYRIQTFDLLWEVCLQTPTFQMKFTNEKVDWNAIDASVRV